MAALGRHRTASRLANRTGDAARADVRLARIRTRERNAPRQGEARSKRGVPVNGALRTERRRVDAAEFRIAWQRIECVADGVGAALRVCDPDVWSGHC